MRAERLAGVRNSSSRTIPTELGTQTAGLPTSARKRAPRHSELTRDLRIRTAKNVSDTKLNAAPIDEGRTDGRVNVLVGSAVLTHVKQISDLGNWQHLSRNQLAPHGELVALGMNGQQAEQQLNALENRGLSGVVDSDKHVEVT